MSIKPVSPALAKAAHTKTKAKPKAKAKPAKSGVDAIIDYLDKNRKLFGAIVVGVAPMPGKELVDERGEPMGINVASADRVFCTSAEERAHTGIRSATTKGVASYIQHALGN